jgi:hypothetical protein
MPLNAHYLLLFKNPRDSTQIDTLSRQIHPGKYKILIECFQDAMRKPYGHLVIDLKTDTRRRIIQSTYVYLPRGRVPLCIGPTCPNKSPRTTSR